MTRHFLTPKNTFCYAFLAFIALGCAKQPQAPYSNEASEQLIRVSFKSTDQNTYTLQRWAGKTRVVNFWATWCGPCKEEIPDLIRLNEQMRSQGVQVIGIGLDEESALEAFAHENGIDFPVLIGNKEIHELSAKLGNRAYAIPFTLILTPSSNIASSHVGRLSFAKLQHLVQSAIAAENTKVVDKR